MNLLRRYSAWDGKAQCSAPGAAPGGRKTYLSTRRVVLARSMTANATSLEEIARSLPPKGRLMGLDLGTKTIGLALSDIERRLASPLKRAADFEIQALVFGLPLNMDGTEGPRAQATRAFMRNLRKLTPLPFVFWDERLSTAAVTRELIAQDASRAKRAEVVDRMAAAYILQGALDRLARLA